MKSWMILIAVCLSGMVAHASTYPYLTFLSTDGTTTLISTAGLVIRFSDGKLIATNGTETKEMSVASLTRMSFSDSNATGLQEGCIQEVDGQVEAFSIGGLNMGKFSSVQAFRQSAPAGIYVVKGNGKIQKIVQK